MKAMKVTSSSSKSNTKVLGATMASKDMKTMMKAQKSRKTMKAATAKGESQKAKDKSINENYMERTAVYGFNAKNAKVSFYYGRKPCTKTANELKMIVSTILPCLQAGVLASNAKQVIAHHF